MTKHRRIRGDGPGVPLTVWVSQDTKNAIEAEAKRLFIKPSTVVRAILEDWVGRNT